MVDLSAHKAAQNEEADRLSAYAERVGARALSSTAVSVAKTVVSNVLRSSDRAPMDETVADVNEVRSSAELANAVNADITNSEEAVLEMMLEAMEDGLESEMHWQTTQIAGLVWKLTDQDRRIIAGYPVQGHTCAEVSKYMHDQLRYEISGIVTAPLDGSVSVSNVPLEVSQLMTRFGGRVGGAVREAYFAGVQLGVRTVAGAMANAG